MQYVLINNFVLDDLPSIIIRNQLLNDNKTIITVTKVNKIVIDVINKNYIDNVSIDLIDQINAGKLDGQCEIDGIYGLRDLYLQLNFFLKSMTRCQNKVFHIKLLKNINMK